MRLDDKRVASSHINMMRNIIKDGLKSVIDQYSKVAPADLYQHLQTESAKQPAATKVPGEIATSPLLLFQRLMNRGRGRYDKIFGQFSL